MENEGSQRRGRQREGERDRKTGKRQRETKIQSEKERRKWENLFPVIFWILKIYYNSNSKKLASRIWGEHFWKLSVLTLTHSTDTCLSPIVLRPCAVGAGPWMLCHLKKGFQSFCNRALPEIPKNNEAP